MPVKAIPKISIARNGVGAFVQPCHRISIQYCNWGGSSHGIRQLLKNGQLNQIASSRPNIYFDVLKRKGHPQLKFYYNNDAVKEVDIRNLEQSEIVAKIAEHSQNSGNAPQKFNQRVLSLNESVRGIWSPMHTHKDNRHRI